jgi:hypothetical protein
MLTITWDPAKSASNLSKHGLDFDIAKRVFEDPLHLSRQDRMEGNEPRWQTLGMVDGVLLLLVAHTWSDDNGVEHVRIVSARRATRSERLIYEQGP